MFNIYFNKREKMFSNKNVIHRYLPLKNRQTGQKQAAVDADSPNVTKIIICFLHKHYKVCANSRQLKFLFFGLRKSYESYCL